MYWFTELKTANDDIRKQFGVVVGCTGTGKSEMVRIMCNKSQEGTIYYKPIEAKNFTMKLVRDLGMKIAPSNIMDIILSIVLGLTSGSGTGA